MTTTPVVAAHHVRVGPMVTRTGSLPRARKARQPESEPPVALVLLAPRPEFAAALRAAGPLPAHIARHYALPPVRVWALDAGAWLP